MKRSHVGIIGLGSLLAAAAVWFFFVRAPAPSAKRPPAIATAAAPSGSAAAEAPAKPPPPSGPELRWEWDRDPEGPLRLDGQVVDQDGEPVGDALIVISTQPPATTRSQADGSFFFDKLVARRFTLSARAGARVGSVQTKLTSTSDPVVLRVRAGATVAVLVHDEAEKPIGGATVRLEGSEDFGASAPTATTSAEGKALLTGVEGGWTSVVAEAPGYARGAVSSLVGAASPDGKPVAELSLTLLRGVAVSGQVVDEGGKPVAGARVSYDTSGFGFGGSGRGEAKSDDKGGFRFAALAPGQYTFGASDGEHVRSLSKPIEVGAQPVRDVLITMRSGGSVSGTVVDRAGAAVPFAVLRIAPHPDGGMREAMVGARQVASDERGAFEIRGLPRARLQLRAEGEAATSAILEVSLVEAARREDVRVVLDVEGTISGVVVDEKGEPVPEMQVTCFPDFRAGAKLASFALGGSTSTTSDGSGAFTVRGLPEGSFRLGVERPGAAASYGLAASSKTAKTGDRDVRLVVQPFGRVLGKIVTSDGKPPALAKISLSMMAPITTRDGAFVLSDLEPARYTVTVHGPDFAELAIGDVEVAAGKDTDLGTLTVSRGRRISGVVVDEQQRPVAGAKVRAGRFLVFETGMDGGGVHSTDERMGVSSTISDAQGAFSLSGLSPTDRAQLAAESATGRSEVVSIAPGEGDPPPVTLRLRGFGAIGGAVTVNGKPASEIMVSVRHLDGKPAAGLFAMSNPDGTYLLERIPEGAYEVSARWPGTMRPATGEVKVASGKRSKLDLDIKSNHGPTLVVEVTALPNQQVDSAALALFEGSVTVANGKEMMAGGRRAVSQGQWMSGQDSEFPDLKPGAYTICGVPMSGDWQNPRAMQRAYEAMDKLAATCKPVALAAAPARQTVTLALPAMKPLPEPPPPRE